MRRLGEDELLKEGKELGKNLYATEVATVSVSRKKYRKTIDKCNRIIIRKIQSNEKITEGEKWFYENYHFVAGIGNKNKCTFHKLPIVHSKPRILLLARFLVNNSLQSLTKERTEKFFRVIAEQVDFTYGEINALSDALAQALFEQLYIVSKRLLSLHRCQTDAVNPVLKKENIRNYSYLFYFFQNDSIQEQDYIYLKQQGISDKKVATAHHLTELENTELAETIFLSLRDFRSFLPSFEGIKLLSAYKVLGEKFCFSHIHNSTLYDYFAIIEKVARKEKVSEKYVAERVKKLCEKNFLDPSHILFDHISSLRNCIRSNRYMPIKRKDRTMYERLFVASALFLSGLLTVCSGLITQNVLWSILAFCPLWFLSERIIHVVLGAFPIQHGIPKLNDKKIPKDIQAGAVISEYCQSVEQLKKSLFHAKVIKSTHKEDNVSVFLLLDTPASETALSQTDRSLIEYLEKEEKSKGIYVFLRKKELQKDNLYRAPERKRGALMALFQCFVQRTEKNFLYIGGEYPVPDYVYTLDSDTMLLPGAIVDAVNIARHPYNRQNAVFASYNKINMFSVKTVYAERFRSECGYEGYPSYSGLFNRLFGKEVFCGKGLIRVKPFFEQLNDALPSEKILSHDILEGSIVSTCGGGMTFEDAPNTFLSDRERRKRWQRGDIQLLPFIFGRWKNDNKERIQKNISPFSMYIMGRNIFRILYFPILFVLLVLGLFIDKNATFSAICLYSLPYFIDILCLVGNKKNMNLSVFCKKIYHILCDAVENFLLIGYYAVSDFFLLAATVGKMVCGKNLLEWTPFLSTQCKSKFSGYLREFMPFIALSTVLISVAFATNKSIIFPIGYFVLFLFVLGELYVTSEWSIRKKVSGEQREILLRYAGNTYRYFQFMQNQTGIIGDHLQIKPYKGIAETTSPTNIGFSLLAEICGEKLGLCTEKEAMENIEHIILSIEKLPKWNGNLYNWYNITTLTQQSDYVSSVDSGNFLACLLITHAYLMQKNSPYYQKIETLVSQTNLEKLYDKTKNLFYIGFDGKNYGGHYDLLTSEAGILSMMYLALYGNSDHFFSLGREYATQKGSFLLSWSGTMFEVLMPTLFFDAPQGSLLYETAFKHVLLQEKHKINGVWGVSESGWYMFDENNRYQYTAFGLNELSLSFRENSNVVAPYASALALSFAPDKVIENLKKLEKKNMFHEMGFYESFDFTEGKPVEEIMSHHQGMMLFAITEYLCSDCLKNLLLRYPAICANRMYLNEKPSEKKYYRKKESGVKPIKGGENGCYFMPAENNTFSSCMLSDGEYSFVGNANGSSFSRYGSVFLRKKGEYHEAIGTFFYCKIEGKTACPTYLPFSTEIEGYSFLRRKNEIEYENSADNIVHTIRLLPRLRGEVHHLKADCAEVNFYSTLILNDEGYEAHPAFSDMFLSCEKSGDNIMIFSRSNQEKSIYLAVRVEGTTHLEWECNKGNFIGRGRTPSNPLFDKKGDYPSCGDILSPCIGFYAQKKRANAIQVAILVSKDKKELLQTISALPQDFLKFARHFENPDCLPSNIQNTLCPLLYGRNKNYDFIEEIPSDYLTKPLVILEGGKQARYDIFLYYLKEWRKIGQEVRTIFVTESEDEKADISSLFGKNFFYDIDFCSAEKAPIRFAKIVFSADGRIIMHQTPCICFKEEKSQEDFPAVEKPPLVLQTGEGGFDNKGNYVFTAVKPPLLPYSHVICGRSGGLVRTTDGGGYFYFGNSRETKAIPFDNDYVANQNEEKIFLCLGEKKYNLSGGAGENRYTVLSKGVYSHIFSAGKILCRYKESMLLDGKIKMSEVTVRGGEERVKIEYHMMPSLYFKSDFDCVFAKKEEGKTIHIRNIRNRNELFIRFIWEGDFVMDCIENKIPYFHCYATGNQKLKILCSPDNTLLQSVHPENIDFYLEEFQREFSSVGSVNAVTKEKSLDEILSFLPYQILSSRINGKTGFYQTGGATGFRDQLQDCMALQSNPELLKKQIIACCKHQYREGDVMHWWHEEKYGLRTKISDDRIFLVLAVCRYMEITGEREILDEELPYLLSPVLRGNETDRFENPPYTDYTESVEKHCKKALKCSLKYGEHRLICMGTGDWNDGMNEICKQGKGESVLNSILLYHALMSFAPYCPQEKKEMYSLATDLKTAINLYAFDKDRYMRLYSDEGKWYGNRGNKTLELDITIQSLAVLCNVAEGERAKIVLQTCQSLIDRKGGLIKLLSPEQTHADRLGYISDYPKGIRENGGQYTHGAIWYLTALCKVGEQDLAFELFQMINPAEKCMTKEGNATYKGEPYVFAGDVYANKDNYGRCGWSWYTGSAGWAYRLICEQFFGLKISGDTLFIEPHLPKKLNGSLVTFRYKNSTYLIEYHIGIRNKITQNDNEKEFIALEENIRCTLSVETESV